jgi:hypothetical protein
MFDAPVSFERPFGVETRRVGVHEATTFPGLCSDHDAEIFRPVETESLGAECTDEQLFLLSYRTLLKTAYEARASWEQNRSLLTLVVDADDGGSSHAPAASAALWSYLSTIWSDAIVSNYARLYRARQFVGAVQHLARRESFMLPFAIAECFEPAFDREGRRRPLPPAGRIPPFATLSVVPERGGSVVALSYAAEQEADLSHVLEPLRGPKDSQEFVDRVWELALRYCGDNIVLSPQHWNVVPERKKRRILDFITACLRGEWVSMRPAFISLFEQSGSSE